MKRVLGLILIILANAIMEFAYADDLVSIYHQALTNDPTFKIATATYLAAKENLPISEANLLPNINFSAGLNRERSLFSGINPSQQPPIIQVSPSPFYSNVANYSLNLTQPVLNFANFAAVASVSASVKQAGFTYQAAMQDLILRTSIAYFNVLQASDILRLIQSEKRSFYLQYKDAKQRYKVGLIAITSFYEAKSRYDLISAQEITAQNDLSVNKEKLREIIGFLPDKLAVLKPTLPLIEPNPTDVNTWILSAQNRNASLLAARSGTIAARENVKVKGGGHLPIVNAVGSYQYLYNSNASGFSDQLREKVGTIGLNLNLPIYQGGLVSAEVRQANDLYQQASSTQEQTYRSVVSQTHQAFLGVINAIKTIYADRQAIISNKSNYEAMTIAYRFGTRTMTDVLDAEAKVYSAERDLAVEEYTYIIQSLTLKQAVGVLNANDIYSVNDWLTNKSAYRNYDLISDKKIPRKKNKKIVTQLKTQKKVLVNHELSESERYLLSLNSKHYILQLAANPSERAAIAFIKRHSAPMPIFHVSVTKNQQKLYKVLTGEYKDYKTANSARNELIKRWQDKSIWIRKIYDVQNEVVKR